MRRTALIATIAAALLLVGCTGTDAAPPETAPVTEAASPAPEPSPTLSDEEALRIAVETFQAYLDASVQVLDSGGDPNGVLESLSTEGMAEDRERTIQLAGEQDWSVSGTVEVFNEVLNRVLHQDGVVEIVIDACTDTSTTETLDADGTPTRPEDSDTLSAVEVLVIGSRDEFRLDKIEPSTLDVCRVE